MDYETQTMFNGIFKATSLHKNIEMKINILKELYSLEEITKIEYVEELKNILNDVNSDIDYLKK